MLKKGWMLSSNQSVIFLGEFRDSCFLQMLMQGINYKKIPLSNHSDIVKMMSIISGIYSLLFIVRYVFYNVPLGELIKSSMIYGLLKKGGFSVVFATYGSNRKLFGLLASALPEINFVGQYPSLLRSVNIERIYPSPAHYYVFGDDDMSSLVKLGHPRSNIHISGSIYTHLYRQSKYYVSDEKQFDLCLISKVTHQWGGLKNELENELILIENIKKYAKDKDINIAVCLRPQSTNAQQRREGVRRERIFYESLVQEVENVTLIAHNNCSFSTYSTISKSKVVVTQISTLGFEAVGLGSRTLFFQPLEFEYKIPNDYKFSVFSKKYDAFCKCLNHILTISDSEYSAETVKFKNNYIATGKVLTSFQQ
jgi:hypothetical protein